MQISELTYPCQQHRAGHGGRVSFIATHASGSPPLSVAEWKKHAPPTKWIWSPILALRANLGKLLFVIGKWGSACNSLGMHCFQPMMASVSSLNVPPSEGATWEANSISAPWPPSDHSLRLGSSGLAWPLGFRVSITLGLVKLLLGWTPVLPSCQAAQNITE